MVDLQSDAGDIGLLYDGAQGKAIWTEPTVTERTNSAEQQSDYDKGQELVDSIIGQIDSTHLAKVVGVRSHRSAPGCDPSGPSCRAGRPPHRLRGSG